MKLLTLTQLIADRTGLTTSAFAEKTGLSHVSLRRSNCSKQMSRNSAKIFCDAVGITLEELEKDHKFTLTTSRKTYGKRKRNLQVLMAAKTFGLGVSDQELRPVHNALKVLRPFLAMLTPQQFELMVHVAKLYVPPNEKNTVAT